MAAEFLEEYLKFHINHNATEGLTGFFECSNPCTTSPIWKMIFVFGSSILEEGYNVFFINGLKRRDGRMNVRKNAKHVRSWSYVRRNPFIYILILFIILTNHAGMNVVSLAKFWTRLLRLKIPAMAIQGISAGYKKSDSAFSSPRTYGFRDIAQKRAAGHTYSPSD